MLGFQLSRYGIWFPYQGDEVLYTWPWARSPLHHRWISLLCEGGFRTLTAYHAFWIEYEIAERRACRRDRILALRGKYRDSLPSTAEVAAMRDEWERQ